MRRTVPKKDTRTNKGGNSEAKEKKGYKEKEKALKSLVKESETNWFSSYISD